LATQALFKRPIKKRGTGVSLCGSSAAIGAGASATAYTPADDNRLNDG